MPAVYDYRLMASSRFIFLELRRLFSITLKTFFQIIWDESLMLSEKKIV